MTTNNFTVQFWGVRGKIATPGRETLRYGGNTPCLEMLVGEKRLIFDGGTGIRELGNHLLGKMPVEAHLFFTHCHWDRIQGFPFFVPAFIPGNHFRIYGANAIDGASFQERLTHQMLGPNFPVPIQVMQSKLEFHPLEIDRQEQLDGIVVTHNVINYAHHSLGYRVSGANGVAVYATDTEGAQGELETNLVKLAQDADLLILDAPPHEKMSSSVMPWQRLVAIAKAARVKRLLISAHDPKYNDRDLDRLETELQREFDHGCLAREGMVIAVPDA